MLVDLPFPIDSRRAIRRWGVNLPRQNLPLHSQGKCEIFPLKA